MTRVTSLSDLTFGNAVYDTFFYASDGTTDYKLSFSDVADAIGTKFYGALWTNVNTRGIVNGYNRLFTVTASAEYDTGSFTDANSIGVFYINQAPKFTHVQLGFCVKMNQAQEYQYYVTASAGGTTERMLGGPYYVSEGYNYIGGTAIGAPIPVSSGDSFSMIAQKGATDQTAPWSMLSGVMAFWIRGLGRA